jgi:DNA polymerase-3 subunit epsilon
MNRPDCQPAEEKVVILAFDTETTGLPNFRQPSDDVDQPHLVQLAMILLDDDGEEVSQFDMIIKPEGWVISPEATAIHGISHQKAMRVGISEKVAARLFANLMYGLGAPVTALAHNAPFDLRIMRIAMLRAGFTKEWLDQREPMSFCTMRAATPILNLPPTPKMVAAGFNKPKSANLGECVQHFFSEALDGAHNALVDVRACVRVYRHITTLPQAQGDEEEAV